MNIKTIILDCFGVLAVDEWCVFVDSLSVGILMLRKRMHSAMCSELVILAKKNF